MRIHGLMAALALAACANAAAPEAGAQAQVRSLAEILEQSPPSDWRTVDPENTIYMDLPGG
ncbi:MAG: hypothetical protein K2X34_02360, partial [Hyphomonadaceae bacterium]|nr:hypothetical protein [Hyphomonadaceae bacterium]